ncbi:MAG: hypothetical protein QXW80_03080 [Candidatus Micrarchaeia archaeon]|uniref:hypothetical protein n=1 Tax=Saccharolobus sp. TaxID=2100761 RepID=UPI0031775861
MSSLDRIQQQIQDIRAMLSSLLERVVELEQLKNEVYNLKQIISDSNNRQHISDILKTIPEYTTEYGTIEQHMRPLSEMEIEEEIPKKHRLSQYPKEIQDKVNYCADLVIKLGREIDYINSR